LVSVAKDARETAKKILDGVNQSLEKIGLEQFTGRDDVEAVIFLLVRNEKNCGGIIGRTEVNKVVTAVLEFLVNYGIISEPFARAVYEIWLMTYVKAEK
jgi:hypothetical protein